MPVLSCCEGLKCQDTNSFMIPSLGPWRHELRCDIGWCKSQLFLRKSESSTNGFAILRSLVAPFELQSLKWSLNCLQCCVVYQIYGHMLKITSMTYSISFWPLARSTIKKRAWVSRLAAIKNQNYLTLAKMTPVESKLLLWSNRKVQTNRQRSSTQISRMMSEYNEDRYLERRLKMQIFAIDLLRCFSKMVIQRAC